MVETQVKNVIEDWCLLDERLCDVCDPTGISNALTFDNVNACQCELFPCIHDRFQTKLVKEKPMRKKRFRKIKKRIEKHAERFSYLNICQEDEDLSKGRHNQKDLNLNLEFYCDFEKGNCLDKNENEMCCFEEDESITESDNNNLPLALTDENELTEPDPVDDNDNNDNEDENENNQNIDIVRINNDKNAEKVEEEKSDNERRTLHSKSESCLQNLKKVPNENLGKVLKEIETLSRSSSWESKVRYCDHKKGQSQKQKAESNSKSRTKKKENSSDSDSDSDVSSSSSDSSSSSTSDSSSDSSSSSDTLSSSSNSDDDSSSSSSSGSDSSSDEEEDDYNRKGGTKKQKISH